MWDLDSDGEVTFDEFVEAKAMLILEQRDALVDALTSAERADARRAFDLIDTDGR